MLRIDFYVQHLVKHQAKGIELVSGRPVTFQFADGDRHSNKPIGHPQIAQLVQEAAPASALEDLRSRGAAEFIHKSGSGMDVKVELRAPSPAT